jgi:hypothetical protein
MILKLNSGIKISSFELNKLVLTMWAMMKHLIHLRHINLNNIHSVRVNIGPHIIYINPIIKI